MSPARATGRHRLDIEVSPTPAQVPEEQVAEALYVLNVESDKPTIEQIASSPLGSVLVALVKHMAGRSGFYQAIALDDPTGLWEDAAEQHQPDEQGPHPGRFPLR